MSRTDPTRWLGALAALCVVAGLGLLLWAFSDLAPTQQGTRFVSAGSEGSHSTARPAAVPRVTRKAPV